MQDNLKNVLFEAVKIVNFVLSQPMQNWLFPHCTEPFAPSTGKCVTQFIQIENSLFE